MADGAEDEGAKQVIRGVLAESFVQRHPSVAGVDKALSWAMMLGMLGTELLIGFASVFQLLTRHAALDLMNVAGKACSISIAFLAFMLFHTYCYYDPRMRKLMSASTRFTPDGFMRIGFVPIPAAASVGILLFLTGCIVAPSVQGGGMLQAATAGPGDLVWVDLEYCMASSIEASDYLDRWGARMDRTAPYEAGSASAKFFDYMGMNTDTTPKEGDCFRAGQSFTKDDVIDPVSGEDRKLSNLINPEGSTDGSLCMYLCVSWQTINLQTLISGVGSITAGAAIVVTVTEWMSDKFGIQTVRADTKPETLSRLFVAVGPRNPVSALFSPFRASMVFTCLPILFFGAFLKYFLIVKIDADGFGTVDYYTTYTMIYSLVLVVMMRFWHLFEQRPNIFTKKLWGQGVDTFVVSKDMYNDWQDRFGKGEFKKIRTIGSGLVLCKIDLYQWIHLRGVERHQLLINKCRQPAQENNDAGDQLVTIGPTEVEVDHEVNMGAAGTVTAKKKVTIPGNTAMTIVDFKDDDNIDAKVKIDGVEETVVVDKMSVLEDTDEWDKLVISFVAELAASGEDTSSVAMAGVGQVNTGAKAGEPKGLNAPLLDKSPPKSAMRGSDLKEKLNWLEGRVKALEK